jgi:predicted component of viral defense system (DUF524 family)
MTLDDQLKLFLAFAAAVTVLWGFLRWVLRVQPRRQVFQVLKEERANFDELLFEALDRNDRNRDTFRNYTERVFADVVVAQAKTQELAETNKDRLAYVEESLSRMGAALAKDVAQAMRESTSSNERQTQVMREMQAELRKLSDAYLLLDATVKQWDGHERRSNPR